MNNMTQRYDLIVIGAGPGGYVAAIRAAQLGLKTACIDRGSEPGGTCLNVGCIPSKTLLQSTELYARLQKDGSEHGIIYSELSADFKQMLKRKEKVVKGLVEGVRGLLKKNKIDYFNGEARFVDAHTIEVKEGDGKGIHLEASNFILATGSEPIGIPDLPIDEKRIVTSTGALSLSKVPKRLVVIGGGVIGVELASVYQRLGTEVLLIEMLDRICPAMDVGVSQALLQILKKQGLHFMLSSRVITSVVLPDEIVITVQQGDQLANHSADVVLVAVGRRPYTEGLNLQAIGVETNARGFIPVSADFRTAQPHIFAIGDVIEGVMLAHRASQEGVAVAELIAGQKPFINYMSIPNVIYTYPEVAAVGLTEEEAHAAGLEVVVGSSLFKGNPRARCSLETDGFVKVIGELKTGRLIGMHIIGPHASELIEEGMVAIDKKATLHDIAYAPHAHPTLSEAIKEAALAALSQPIHG
jgi:dihydrolipoamide dehydrogenase